MELAQSDEDHLSLTQVGRLKKQTVSYAKAKDAAIKAKVEVKVKLNEAIHTRVS